MPTSERRPLVPLRWMIAILLCAAIGISYFDRSTLGLAIKAIEAHIKVSNEQYAWLNSAFLFAYGLMYIGGGKLMDALGTRRGFLIIMIWWSLACASHGFATSFAMLAGSRLALGFGEGGGFPAATKAVAEWFPVKERSTAMGIINAGSAFGSIFAYFAVPLVLLHFQWPWAFFLSGAIGLLWTGWWVWEYYTPERHPRLTQAEREVIDHLMVPQQSREHSIPWLRLLSYRQVQTLVAAKFLTDGAWYFYLFWLPKYLYDARNFDTQQVGYYGWIPQAAAGAGCLLGGWLSSYLVGRGYSLNASRKVAMGLSVVIMPCVFFVPMAPISIMIVLFSMAYFGQQSWSTLVMTIPADIFPRHSVGSVAGFVGCGGAMGGIVFQQLFGYMLDHHSGYGPVLAIAGSLHVIAFIILSVLIPRVDALDTPAARAGAR